MDGLKGLWETLKQIRHQMPRPKFCPKCKGHNVYSNPTLGVLPTTYRCRDCGYEGPLVIEIDPEEEREAHSA